MADLLNKTNRNRLDRNEVWIWLNAGALALSLCAVVFIVLLIMRNGLIHFWPNPIYAVEYTNAAGQAEKLIGERVDINTLSRIQYIESGGDASRLSDDAQVVERWLFNTGNRRTNPPDFRWVYAHDVTLIETPAELAKVERIEWGPAFGRIIELRFDNADGSKRIVNDVELNPLLQNTLARLNSNREAIASLEHGTINQINAELKTIRLQQRALNLDPPADAEARLQQLASQEAVLLQTYLEQEQILSGLLKNLEGSALLLEIQSNAARLIELADTLYVTYPNNMGGLEKVGTFLANIGRFLSDNPREANTEGGVFPAIFGTVLMVLLMSVVVTPIGVVTAIYLHEYASQTTLVRMLRIAVSNLAGVPSIVYGVFGLGFFVYFLGGNIDQLFYADALPAPTFGTPGLFWASLTLALLTVPVVIVSTEEGLARIPRSLREGSLALGATRAETLIQVVLPMATPAVLTGVILAVARAAGEVAPLMLVGVVKLAPALPIDGEFPFLHLDRKFMHLGFHIYDVGFQSPNVEAARPLVYATALLLISIIVGLNLAAITLRHRLEKRYRSYEQNNMTANDPAAHSDTQSDTNISLSVKNLSMQYDNSLALKNINVDIPAQKVTAFIGPSGCGKSTLLRCFNRMNDLITGAMIEGSIELEGENIYDPRVDVAELRRRVGMVFQRPNPFPKSVYENVAYGLKIQGEKSTAVLDQSVEWALRSAALWEEVRDRLHESALSLSGGQQQRLVIARAIAVKPSVLLLDEPASALDPISTLKIEELIHQLKDDYTIVIVTHNMQQAARVSDFTAFLNLGELVEYGDTDTIFRFPKEKSTEDYITGRYGQSHYKRGN